MKRKWEIARATSAAVGGGHEGKQRQQYRQQHQQQQRHGGPHAIDAASTTEPAVSTAATGSVGLPVMSASQSQSPLSTQYPSSLGGACGCAGHDGGDNSAATCSKLSPLSGMLSAFANSSSTDTESTATGSGSMSVATASTLAPSASALASAPSNRNDHQLHDHEAQLARELHELSIEQRQRVYERIHGVADDVEETDDFIRSKLHDFHRSLAAFCKQKANRSIAASYEQAQFLCPQRVLDHGFVLMFLRSEEYDVEAAVRRFVKYFAAKVEFFGVECLVQDITLDELSEGDVGFLRQGFLQMLPRGDQSGRPILVAFNKHSQFDDPMNLVRTNWFIIMRLMQGSVTAQRKGVVFVAYETIKGGAIPPPELALMKLGQKEFEALPIRMAAFHFCYDNAAYHPMMSLLHIIVGRQSRMHFRSHFGSDLECRYRLMTFGIRTESLPVDREGYMDASQHARWIEGCRRQSTQHGGGVNDGGDANDSNYTNDDHIDASDDDAIVPTMKDILLGKGRRQQEYPGNRQVDEIVATHWDEYQSSSKTGKTVLFKRLIRTMKADGVRFLKKVCEPAIGDIDAVGDVDNVDNVDSLIRKHGRWVEVDDGESRKKLAHSFRNRPVISKYYESRGKLGT